MGTWISHLRIAENLLDRFQGLDEVNFTFGCLAPDSGKPNADWSAFDPPKEISHFLISSGNESAVEDLRFYRQYLLGYDQAQNPAAYSFLLGYFVHLVSDRLWSEKVGKVSKQLYASLFAGQSEPAAWEIIKKDWYDLDHLYVRDHPNCLFWRVFLVQPTPTSPLPFVARESLDEQMLFIRKFYSQPEVGLVLERPYPYLNEATMTRYVLEASTAILRILRLLSACPPPEGLDSATLLLPSNMTAPFEAPLGD